MAKAVDGLIIPEKIPGDDLRPEQIGSVADGLVASAKALRSGADEVTAGWAGLPAVFVAPAAEVVYGAVAPASASAHVFAKKVDVIAKALHHYADGLGSVKRTFAAIKADAVTFRAKIGADGRVWMPPQQTKKYEWDSQAQVGRSQFGAGSAQDVVDYLRSRGETARIHYGTVQLRASWRESGDFIDQNNRLLDRVADAYAALNALEADCANTINAQRDDCVAEVVAVQGWQLKQSGANTADLPWGHRVDEDRNCGESFWWGAGNAGLSMVQGLGSLVSYNPTTNGWGDWDNAGKAWAGVGTGLGSLLLALSPVGTILAAAGVPLAKDAQTKTADMLKSLVAWDTWSKNPSEAAGAVLVNVGTFFIPGAGEVGGAIKALTIGTKLEIVASALTKVEAVTSKVTAVIPDTLSDLLTKLKTDHVDTHIDIDVPATIGAHGDTPAITIHPGGGDHAPGVTPGAHTDGPVALHDHPDTPTPGDGAGHPDPGAEDHDPGASHHDADGTVGDGNWGDAGSTHSGGGDPGGAPQDNDPVVWESPEEGVSLTESQKVAADQYLDATRGSEPEITSKMEEIQASTPGVELAGLEYRLKGDDSFYRKLSTDLSDLGAVPTSSDVQTVLNDINDAARYTFKVSDASYAHDVGALIEKLRNDGFEPFGTPKNGWGTDGYKGINSTWIDGTSGQKIEVQFHTAESLEAKETTHPLYEEERAPSTSPQRRAELRAIQNHIFDSVPIPDGATDVFWPKPPSVNVPAGSAVDGLATIPAGEE